MNRAPLRVCLLVLAVIPLTLLSALAAEAPGEEAAPSAASAAPVVPDQMASAGKSAPAQDALRLERQALERIEREIAPRIREQQDLATRAKGLELVEIQKRIGALKREQEKKGLEARIEAARQAGDEKRLQLLLKVSEESTSPRPQPEAPVEIRPVPVRERDGGAR